MKNQTSIVGRIYRPQTNENTIDLSRKTPARLVGREYVIVRAPYSAEAHRPEFAQFMPRFASSVMTFVDIQDRATGIVYRTPWHPADLVASENTSLIERAQQLTAEFKARFEDGAARDKCAVVFVATQNTDDSKVQGGAFVGGIGNNIIEAISCACIDNDNALELFSAAISRARLLRTLKPKR